MTATEEFAHGFGVEGGGHDDDAEVWAGGELEAAEEGEREVGFEVTLVKFVEDDGGDVAEGGVLGDAAGEHTFGEETEAGAGAGDFFEADLVADGLAELFAEFERDAAGGHAGGDAAGFEDEDIAGERQERGWDAGGFPCAGFGFEDEVGGGLEPGEDAGEVGVDREGGREAGGVGQLFNVAWLGGFLHVRSREGGVEKTNSVVDVGWTLERRGEIVQPVAAQIGMTVGSARDGLCNGSFGQEGNQEGHDHGNAKLHHGIVHKRAADGLDKRRTKGEYVDIRHAVDWHSPSTGPDRDRETGGFRSGSGIEAFC